MAKKFERDGDIATEEQTEETTERPRLYRVLMHNDNYTTREFVVDVLVTVFRHSESEAVQVMLHVHNRGVGVCGVFTKEVAETKVATVERLAREEEFPLQLTLEPEADED